MNRLSYVLIIALAMVVSIYLLRRRQQNSPLSPLDRRRLMMAALVGSMLGAKIPYLLHSGLLTDWLSLFNAFAWMSDGKTVLGGIFGGYFAVELTKARLGIQVSTGDQFAVPIATGLAIGRLGCFVAGCCYGTPTDLPWGIHFQLANDPSSVCRHPVQIYESLFHTIALISLVWTEKANWLRGQKLKAYLLAYLLFRFCTEMIRPHEPMLGPWSGFQVTTVLLAAILIALWCRDAQRANFT